MRKATVLLSALLDLVFHPACAEEPMPTPTTKSQGDEIQLGGRNGPISFARSGKYWGAAWLSKTGAQERIHWFDKCRQAIFFTVFDDDLKLLLEKPIRVKKQEKCAPVKISIRGTPKGFAVSPSDVGAEFDLQSGRFVPGSRFPETGSQEDSRPKEHGEGFILREGEQTSLFAAHENTITRQRCSDDGEPLGEPEPLVVETIPEGDKTPGSEYSHHIYNLNAGVIGSQAVLLFTVGNGKLTLYSCKTGEKRSLGEAYFPTMLCDGTRCIASMSGQKIRFVQP
ncbi:MAG: hypothetical protein JXR96_30410 [Deltaproteobacteria bacterium]|nr:hypothetical protein [Deltaproteobacteria bacterium]